MTMSITKRIAAYSLSLLTDEERSRILALQ
jgi:hypothetical protein